MSLSSERKRNKNLLVQGKLTSTKGKNPIKRKKKKPNKKKGLPNLQKIKEKPINSKTPEDQRAFINRIKENNLPAVRRLIESLASIDINAKDKKGQTPLHIAAGMDKDLSMEITKLLIEKRADIDAKDNDNNSPLHIALKKNNLDITTGQSHEITSKNNKIETNL